MVIIKVNEMVRIVMIKCKFFFIIYIFGNCFVCNVKFENIVICIISVIWYIKYDNL